MTTETATEYAARIKARDDAADHAWTVAQAAGTLPDPPFNPCDYHAGHECRKCYASITDREFIDAGLFFSLCTRCLISVRQSLREQTA